MKKISAMRISYDASTLVREKIRDQLEMRASSFGHPVEEQVEDHLIDQVRDPINRVWDLLMEQIGDEGYHLP